ncbi:MAG: hypothetical protein AAGC46_16825 [Solirubrobacteraceae bacterium]|nr:hypothetical protein [Patulibacter sp.]
MRTQALTTSVLSVAAFAALLAATAPGASAASTCKKHSTEFARKGGGTLWLSPDKRLLYGCAPRYEEKAVDIKLGPWSPKSRYAFDGASAVWTVRSGSSDRVWAADATETSSPAWLKGVTPVVGPGSKTDAAVQGLAITGAAAAWVTTKSTVTLAVDNPDDIEPTLIGAGTPGATATPATSPTSGLPQGLVADPPKAKGTGVLVGRWESVDAATLAKTLKVSLGGGGDGDDCGGVNEWKATVTPVAGAAPVGIDWYSRYSSVSGPCA